jgi:hypothetical protein
MGTDGEELRNRILPYARRRGWKCTIPLGIRQGQAPAGWLLFLPPARNLGTASTCSYAHRASKGVLYPL